MVLLPFLLVVESQEGYVGHAFPRCRVNYYNWIVFGGMQTRGKISHLSFDRDDTESIQACRISSSSSSSSGVAGT